VIALPPLLVGAVHETVTEESPNVATALVGAPGIAAGTTTADADDELPEPTLFLATTVNVYSDPLVRPVMEQLVVDVVQVNDPGEPVTV